MKRRVWVGAVLVAGIIALGSWYWVGAGEPDFSESEAGFGEVSTTMGEAASISDVMIGPVAPDSMSAFQESLPPVDTPGRYVGWSRYWQEFTPEEEQLYGNWVRPAGPLRVGLQAGHWNVDAAPEELAGLRTSSGASGGGKKEWEVVLAIAERTKVLLEKEGIEVDLLPATIPIDYSADAFVSIHADGNSNPARSGFKISGPQRDFSGTGAALVDAVYDAYEKATGLDRDANITRRMSGYYAFNWRRYDHAVHPMTSAIIVETGFLTSSHDRAIIVAAPDRAARGIAEGILIFLKQYPIEEITTQR